MNDLNWIERNWVDTVFLIFFGVFKFQTYEVCVPLANHIKMFPKFYYSTSMAFKFYDKKYMASPSSP